MPNIVDTDVLDRQLNSEQAAAAKKINGPMLILAGAGSGKTRTITYKIAHLVSKYQVDSNRILAVTFTNKSAREMKERIQKLLDCKIGFNWMGTFHSVCLRLLKLCLSKESVVSVMKQSSGKWYDENFSIYDTDDQKRILKQIMKEDNENVEAAEIKKVHGAISRYKNTVLYDFGTPQLQTPAVAIERAGYPDEEKRAIYYQKYQNKLLESNAMDFDDLLFNTVLLLQKLPALGNQLKERFQYVVVDEYQDTNDVQYELLKLLINPQHNITVVGDDDQSIYGWRGANIKIIRNFHKDFSPVTIVKLEQNYRSTSNIVKGAGSVIAHNKRPEGMEKSVFSNQEPGELIHVQNFLDEIGEASAIAETISKAGPNFYANTAVFYRTNAQSRLLEKALNDRRIPCVIFGGTRFWDRKEVKDILAYLRLLSNEKDDAAYLRVINTPPRAIGKTSVENILQRQKKEGGSFWDSLLQEAHSQNRGAPRLKIFTDLVDSWKALIAAGETPLPILAERIINDVGYKEYLRKDDETTADDKIGNVDEMVNALREFDEDHPGATLESFLQDISLLTDGDKKVDTSKGLVTLMTIHMAKGLEFNRVHIAGCDEEIFPLIRSAMVSSAEMNEQMEEERRLFYVGCTRAQKILYLYHAGSRFFQGNKRPFAPSRFLKELDPSVVEIHNSIPSFGGYDDFNQEYRQSPRIYDKEGGISKNFSRSLGYNRASSLQSSIRKKDKRIVYRNPVKVPNPAKVQQEPHIVYDEYSENPFHAGARVRHNTYGIGTILKCYGTGDNTRVDVVFRDKITRTIILKYGSLQVIEHGM